MENKLTTGSRIAVIGGGPAGSFFALYLLKYGGEKGIRPEITIYQQRDFNQPGTKGCKGCAGVIAVPFLKNLGELGLSIPEGIIQSNIKSYVVHSPYTSIAISNPEKGVRIASVFRGGGPRISHGGRPDSFDDWLLAQAKRQGAKVNNQRVSRVSLEHGARIDVSGERLEFDLVVYAAGVNARGISLQGINYIPPKTQTMTEVELYGGTSQVESKLGNEAHVFLIPHSGLVFGTLVPKGDFINVSIMHSGKQSVPVKDFLRYDFVRSLLPDSYERACECRPKIITSCAQNYYADRFVAIGDATVSRLYKNGIGSSLLTAREAARVVIAHGTARGDFERHYYPFCKNIARDNWWGKQLFSINNRAKNSNVFFLTQQKLIGDEQKNTRGSQTFSKVVWGMFSGSYPYRSIARMAFAPTSLFRLFTASLVEGLSSIFKRERTGPRKLHVGGKKIVILGSGFVGTYTLKHLVPSLNRNENVETTMVSNENFFLFAPLLHEVAMGGIETRHVAYPIRRIQWRDRFNFVQADVKDINLNEKKITTTAGSFNYDYLVLGLGSVTDLPKLHPGKLTADGKGKIFTLKTLNDSIMIRNHIIGIFEQASVEKDPKRQAELLTFVVIGAGYTGVQVVCEMNDFIKGSLIKVYKTIDPARIKIILVEAESEVIGGLHPKLKSYVNKTLKKMKIETRLGKRVTNIEEGKLEINSQESISASTLIWLVGVVSNPQIASLDVAKDEIGRVMVDDFLELPKYPGVYAAGDCAHFKDPRSGQPIPPRAHTGVRQAKVVANNILAEIRGRDKTRYHYSGTPEMVSLGASRAMFRYHGLRLYGFPARIIWVLGYSFLVTGFYNRIRIITDWFLSIIFGRDTTYLKL